MSSAPYWSSDASSVLSLSMTIQPYEQKQVVREFAMVGFLMIILQQWGAIGSDDDKEVT